MGLPEDKYAGNDYLKGNPSWDMGDFPWKAVRVKGIIENSGLRPITVCEVDCGAGGVLAYRVERRGAP